MAQKVSFSFENASFMADDASIAAIKDRVTAARQAQEMISSAGSIFRLIMTRKSLTASRRLRQRFRVIQTCFLL